MSTKITNENYQDVKTEFNEQKMSFMAELGLIGGITKIHKRDYINHEGLQYLARKQGVRSQRVRVIDWASNPAEGSWVVEATVVDKDGNIHSAIGDASPKNVGPMIANATCRMAGTRAINRCLRRVLEGPGVALTSAEEIPGAADSSDPDLAKLTFIDMHNQMVAGFEREAKMLGWGTDKKIQDYCDGTGFSVGDADPKDIHNWQWSTYHEMDKSTLAKVLRAMKEERHG